MLRLTFLLGAVSLAAATAGEPEKPPYEVPAPKGWGKETIELPPKFAPDVTWKGVEELRFAPNWMKADADTFFSYAILFWLPDDQKTDPKALEKELLAYYRGLAKAVLESKKQKVDASDFTLTIKDAKEKTGKRAGGETYSAFVGELKWVEPFTTGKPFNYPQVPSSVPGFRSNVTLGREFPRCGVRREARTWMPGSNTNWATVNSPTGG